MLMGGDLNLQLLLLLLLLAVGRGICASMLCRQGFPSALLVGKVKMLRNCNEIPLSCFR